MAEFFQDHLPYRRRRPRCCWAPDRFRRVELQGDDGVPSAWPFLKNKQNKQEIWMRSYIVDIKRATT